jgi:hypothetical protein
MSVDPLDYPHHRKFCLFHRRISAVYGCAELSREGLSQVTGAGVCGEWPGTVAVGGGVFAVRERNVCEVVDPVGEQFVGVFVERLYSDSVHVVLLWVDGAGASLTSSRLT